MGLAQREMMSLENLLEAEFVELGIEEDNKASIMNYLNLLKRKDVDTYEHSVRVGLLCSRVAKHMHLDPKSLFYPGILHDSGKALVPPETVKKTQGTGFNEKDRALMNKHPEYSYALLRGIHEFSAEVALRHHEYQQNAYPKVLPKGIEFSKSTKVNIDYLSRLLAMVDFYDALTSRINDFTIKICGEQRLLNKEESKQVMLDKNPDLRYLINNLYENGIF